jgi:hypothetical protein
MGLLDKLSGKTIENTVEQYSEMYGEILLGMHRQLEKQQYLLHKYQHEVKETSEKSKQLFDEFLKKYNDIILSSKEVKKYAEEVSFNTQVVKDIKDNVEKTKQDIMKQIAYFNNQATNQLEEMKEISESIKMKTQEIKMLIDKKQQEISVEVANSNKKTLLIIIPLIFAMILLQLWNIIV